MQRGEKDHPQVRGKLRICRKCLFRNGITPQVRGKQCFTAYGIEYKQDPHRCGENKMRRNVDSGNVDHPRRCGETIPIYSSNSSTIKDHLQVRGKLK